MNERDWQHRENQLVDAHRAADPPLSPAIWQGIEARLASGARPEVPARRAVHVRPAAPRRRDLRGVWLALGAAVLAAAAVVALWFLPRPRALPERNAPVEVAYAGTSPTSASPTSASPTTVSPATASPATASPTTASPTTASPTTASPTIASPTTASPTSALSVAPRASTEPAAPELNTVLVTERAITLAIRAEAGRIEIEPCRGRFVNVTLLGSPHRALALRKRGGRVEVELDGGLVMRGGVAHVLVPADTRVVLSTGRGDVVVRGLGGPLEIETTDGAVELDTAPTLAPTVHVTTDTGAIRWRGVCGGRCRVEARSRAGDITLRTPDPGVFARGAARGETATGKLSREELTCTEPSCASSPLPWRQPAAGHP